MNFRIYDNELNMYVTNNELWSITSCGQIVNSDGCIEEDENRYIVEYSVGMLDSNGKYIFENDIVEESSISYTKNELNKRYYVARFNDKTFKFELVHYYTDGKEVACIMTDYEKYTVVGNTHKEKLK